jgi:hypothetical protein
MVPSTSADAIQIDRTLDAAIESNHALAVVNGGNGEAVAASVAHPRARFQLSTIRDDSREELSSSDEEDGVRWTTLIEK